MPHLRRALGVSFWVKALPMLAAALGVAYIVTGPVMCFLVLGYVIYKVVKLYPENYWIGYNETQQERRERMLKNGPPIA